MEDVVPPIPRSATFDVGTYSDGSGPMLTVSYNTTWRSTRERIWLEVGDDSFISFDHAIARDVCAAIMQAAAALHSLSPQEPSNGE